MSSIILAATLFCFLMQYSTQQDLLEVCKDIPNDQFVGDPFDCARFYQCFDGVGTGVSCPPGMLFDTSQKLCNFEDNVICNINTPETTSIESSTSNSSDDTASSIVTESVIDTEPGTTDTTTTTNPNSAVKDYCKSADTSIPNFFPSSTNCGQYFICINQEPFQLSCAKGRYWNQEKKFCDDPKAVNCQVDTSSVDFPECPVDETVFFPHPEICEFFLFCNYGNLLVQRCPFYYQWDTTKETCVLKDTSDCTKTSLYDHQ